MAHVLYKFRFYILLTYLHNVNLPADTPSQHITKKNPGRLGLAIPMWTVPAKAGEQTGTPLDTLATGADIDGTQLDDTS